MQLIAFASSGSICKSRYEQKECECVRKCSLNLFVDVCWDWRNVCVLMIIGSQSHNYFQKCNVESFQWSNLFRRKIQLVFGKFRMQHKLQSCVSWLSIIVSAWQPCPRAFTNQVYLSLLFLLKCLSNVKEKCWHFSNTHSDLSVFMTFTDCCHPT